MADRTLVRQTQRIENFGKVESTQDQRKTVFQTNRSWIGKRSFNGLSFVAFDELSDSKARTLSSMENLGWQIPP